MYVSKFVRRYNNVEQVGNGIGETLVQYSTQEKKITDGGRRASLYRKE
jgi:hypothetical protein